MLCRRLCRHQMTPGAEGEGPSVGSGCDGRFTLLKWLLRSPGKASKSAVELAADSSLCGGHRLRWRRIVRYCLYLPPSAAADGAPPSAEGGGKAGGRGRGNYVGALTIGRSRRLMSRRRGHKSEGTQETTLPTRSGIVVWKKGASLDKRPRPRSVSPPPSSERREPGERRFS